MPYTDCDTTYIPNTTMAILTSSVTGEQTMYRFTPDDGYVLHLKRNDDVYTDPDTSETITTLRFSSGAKTVNINYDFSVVVQDTYTYTDEDGNEVTIPIEKIGSEEIFALPESIVPNIW